MSQPVVHIRTELNITGLVAMYVGNLESYQGIDLLLDSFQRVANQSPEVELVVIGGEAADVKKYQAIAAQYGIAARVHFLGQKPVDHLSDYLAQADLLVSPRTKGKNTPMKLYSYLGSGKPVVATNLETHTQLLTSEVAVLAEPTPADFAAGILALVDNQALRQRIGQAGKTLVEENYSFTAFQNKLNGLLDWMQNRVVSSHSVAAVDLSASQAKAA